jgi:hypothetical protein
MRYLLQRPLPDELLSSVWVRSARRAGLPIATVTRALTQGRKWAPSFFHVGHLADLAPLMELTPLDLLWQHTVFPYATAFFEPTTFEKALVAALSTGYAAIGMGAVTQSVSDHVRFRRYCPVCAREDQKQWGESYWHRSHNLPGVLLCLGHGRVLGETELQTAGSRRWSYALPHELVGGRALKKRPRAFDVELARLSVATLARAPVGKDGTAPSSQTGRPTIWYREALVAQGLLSRHRQVSVQKLVAWAESIIEGKLTRLGFLSKDADLAWLGLMVRPKVGIPFVPLKHLVFETALALARAAGPTNTTRAAGLVAAAEPPCDRALHELDHVPSGLSGPPSWLLAERDKQYAAAVVAVVRGYKQRREQVRVRDALTEAGCWTEFRHDRTKFPRVSAVVQGLRLSAVSARQING